MNQDHQPWQPTNQPQAPVPTQTPVAVPVYSPNPPAQPMSPLYPESSSAAVPQTPTPTLATAVPQATKPTGVPMFVWIIFIVITLGVAGLATAVIFMK